MITIAALKKLHRLDLDLGNQRFCYRVWRDKGLYDRRCYQCGHLLHLRPPLLPG
jgi:hypothetical protein